MKVNPSGTAQVVAGNATAKVWVETTPPFHYVPKHYEITPATNPNSVSGIITLYFSQASSENYEFLDNIAPSGGWGLNLITA
jgi:hypothetical protein